MHSAVGVQSPFVEAVLFNTHCGFQLGETHTLRHVQMLRLEYIFRLVFVPVSMLT